MRTHQPEIFARIAHVLCPKDYVRYKMTGEFAIDMQEASGTLLLDVTHRRWSSEVAEAAGIPMSWLPRLFEGPEICAHISDGGAAATGLSAGIPVVAGAVTRLGAVGMGIVDPLGIRHDRHQRRCLRFHRPSRHGPARPPAYLLPRSTGLLARQR